MPADADRERPGHDDEAPAPHPGAGGRDPRANEAAAPWLGGLKLGSRIYLVLELLRLLPPTGTGGRS